MVERARVVIVEDQDVVRDGLVEGLVYDGHEIVGVAADEASATHLIDELQPGAVDAFILDGNYTEGKKDAAEGTRVARRVQEKLGRVVIIDMGGDQPIQADGLTRISKSEGNLLPRLLETLRDIPRPSQSQTSQGGKESAA